MKQVFQTRPLFTVMVKYMVRRSLLQYLEVLYTNRHGSLYYILRASVDILRKIQIYIPSYVMKIVLRNKWTLTKSSIPEVLKCCETSISKELCGTSNE